MALIIKARCISKEIDYISKEIDCIKVEFGSVMKIVTRLQSTLDEGLLSVSTPHITGRSESSCPQGAIGVVLLSLVHASTCISYVKYVVAHPPNRVMLDSLSVLCVVPNPWAPQK
jgi:hypothetical protein